MELVPGDEIQTEADSTAILRFADGTEVFVGSNTHIRIGSLWVLFGEIYVKARGRFRVETLYVTAGVEGTEYLLTVDSEAEMSMVVLDGAVRLTSKTGSWEPVALRKLEHGVFLPQEDAAHEPRRSGRGQPHHAGHQPAGASDSGPQHGGDTGLHGGPATQPRESSRGRGETPAAGSGDRRGDHAATPGDRERGGLEAAIAGDRGGGEAAAPAGVRGAEGPVAVAGDQAARERERGVAEGAPWDFREADARAAQ